VNYEALFRAHAGKKIRVGIVGAGEFGRSFVFRSGRVPGLEVVAVADRDPARARAAVEGLKSKMTVVEDATDLVRLDLDVVVEATGEPEAAARTAELAIGAGKSVAMVTKEADCVVGPILQEKAAAKGLFHTPVDGDQPSLLIALVSWARTLGLEVVCGGKAGEYDVIYEGKPPERDGKPHATVPDYCEMTIVANGTGLRPDRPELHAPIARTLELPDLFRPRADGGLLSAPGAVDMFVCLRRPDEASFAGGVFVIVRCDDRASWEVLRGKGIPTSADGRYALLHNPVHLLGIEAPISILSAGLLGLPAARLRPSYDLHARATQALPAGHVLAMGERHTIPGVEALIATARPVTGDAPLPYYMAAGRKLRSAVAAGALITRSMVEAPPDSALWRLREEQDKSLGSGS
jgi:predicted homoserine dehydrogenase-like protein